MATQFYTIPIFIQPLVPIRIDTFIPPRAQWPLDLIELLGIDRAFLYYDSRILNFGIAQHILRTLEYWAGEFPNFQSFYMNLPFGSRIVFENIAKDIHQIRVKFVPMHNLEREYLSVSTLQSMWADTDLPPTIDIAQFSLEQQLHDSVSLVRSNEAQPAHENIVLKALTISPKYLYHELRILLTMPPHPNIHPRPLHLVTKRCRFGGKIGVVGFTTPFHQQGSLRDILPFRQIHGTLRLADQLKWAQQLTHSLIHIQENSNSGYHCDFRLDNILLSDSDDAILIDFEHRGILAHSAAPEVSCLEYVDLLATHPSFTGPLKDKYLTLYDQYIKPHARPNREKYQSGDQGYYTPWLCLNKSEREAAGVYMLGRVFWCLFEGVSAPNAMLGIEYVRESDIEFPEFRRTPLVIRDLVLKCTRGWHPWLHGLTRHGHRLEFGGDNDCDIPGADTVEKIAWCCEEELRKAEDFLTRWDEWRKNGKENIFNRPMLREVAQILGEYKNSLDIEWK